MKLESRHWTFFGLAVVVVIAMLSGFQPEITVSPDTLRMHEYIESLPEGSKLIISFDHEASSLPEIRPLAVALLRHAFSKNLRLIGIALLSEGTGVGYGLMQQVAAEYSKEYGVDYVYLGFKPQYIAAILSMGQSIPATFPEDYVGQPVDQLPLMTGVETYDDLAGVISVADGSLTTHWIEYGGGQYGVRVSAFGTAAMVTTYDPYLNSDQMYAMVGGLRGAAEYEKLIEIGGSGARGMLAQTCSHLYVILLIVIGNVLYFVSRRKGRSS
ncbi:MAG: hypothetical protein DRP45_03290 [Candidatus Zixiibacteriota bacterium]|nr:MAG: hypothetical protein DRP45_03290 [candidate division Zixibacteria bacterium]